MDEKFVGIANDEIIIIICGYIKKIKFEVVDVGNSADPKYVPSVKDLNSLLKYLFDNYSFSDYSINKVSEDFLRLFIALDVDLLSTRQLQDKYIIFKDLFRYRDIVKNMLDYSPGDETFT